MTSAPKFSVVIPTFNRKDTILATLHSIKSQQYRSFEVIVVDDGSDDNTCELIDSFDGLNIQLIRQSNSGPGAARNKGVESAIGEYIAFLDSDDIWFPWTLATYAQVISDEEEPCFITGRPCLFQELSEADQVTATAVLKETFPDYYSSSDEWRWFGVSSFVVRRDAFDEVGGFANGRINGEDADLAMKLGTKPGFVHVTSPQQFAYRLHDGNVTNVSAKSQAGLELLIASEKGGDYPGGGERERERAEIIARHVRPFTISCAKKGQIESSLRLYIAAMREAVLRRRWRFLLGVPLLLPVGVVGRLLRRDRQ